MGYNSIFKFDIRWNWKTATLLAMLAALPNIFGIFHTTVFGVRVHFFQYLIFLAAIVYGPLGGMISGAVGSVYTAVALNNPYIMIGNIILGGFTGFFLRYKINIVLAVLAAYLIQLPWLWVTDIYLAGMPVRVVKGIVIALLLSNLLWALIAGCKSKYVKKFI